MKTIALLTAACLSIGCSSGPLVQTDHDPAADFDLYRSYAWKQEPGWATPLLKRVVVAAVDGQLAGKGWRRVPEATAETLLVGNVSSREDASLNYFYAGNGWNGWNWQPGNGNGMQRVELRTYRIGTLVIDMFDARSKQAIWRAIAQGTVPDSDAQRNRDAMTAVREMFRDFPPPHRTPVTP